MAAEGSSPKIDAVPDVDIDAGGRFKYILIRIVDTSCGASKHIVRGYDWAAYHGKHVLCAFFSKKWVMSFHFKSKSDRIRSKELELCSLRGNEQYLN